MPIGDAATGGQDGPVVVVGAGVAGLAAAASLRRLGHDCVVLEAGGRIGGRAFTGHPAALGGAAMDHGAAWLHDADRNPLTALAAAHGDMAVDFDAAQTHRSVVAGRMADPAEDRAREHLWERFEPAVTAALDRAGRDLTLAEAAQALRDDPWAPTVAAWEGSVISAADADRLSARDWQANRLLGGNLMFAGGLGDFVARRLGPPAGPVELLTPVTAIGWGGRGVRVETARGTIAAAACIVTVSTGVLAAGGIRFDPALPPAVQGAVDGLPMGLATKVALRAAGPDRLGLPDFSTMDRRLDRAGEAMMVFIAWPFGADHVLGYVGGAAAWDLAGAGGLAAEDFARAELRRMLGTRADAALAPGAVVTDWGEHPLFRGAYAYARPGQAGARAALARPLADGRLMFAGEACHQGFAGTVAGAWLSGQDAARQVAAALSGV